MQIVQIFIMAIREVQEQEALGLLNIILCHLRYLNGYMYCEVGHFTNGSKKEKKVIYYKGLVLKK